MTNIGVYLDSDICRWHLDESQVPARRYFELDHYEQDQSDIKVAVFHTPYPYLEVKDTFEQRIDRALAASDQLIVMTSELHDETVDFILRYSQAKVQHFVCGTVNEVTTEKWMDWFITSSYFYKSNPLLEKLNPYTAKEKMFDILLGQRKYHRNIIYNYVKQQGLENCVVMTYLSRNNRIVEGSDTSGWIWPDADLEILHKDLQWTVSQVVHQGQQMALSQVIPTNIYNQTAYSIIAETNFSNHYSFYTEKTVKPIVGKRLFLAFGSQYFLKNLRSMGFKTFDGIIDESYDTVSDIDRRGQMITEQMDYLFNQDQAKILELVKPIAEHNYQVLMETPWHKQSIDQFKKVLTHTTHIHHQSTNVLP